MTGRRKPPNEFIGSSNRKGEAVIDVVNDAIRKAEKAGYDAISIGDADIGTVILNRDAFVFGAQVGAQVGDRSDARMAKMSAQVGAKADVQAQRVGAQVSKKTPPAGAGDGECQKES